MKDAVDSANHAGRAHPTESERKSPEANLDHHPLIVGGPVTARAVPKGGDRPLTDLWSRSVGVERSVVLARV